MTLVTKALPFLALCLINGFFIEKIPTEVTQKTRTKEENQEKNYTYSWK